MQPFRSSPRSLRLAALLVGLAMVVVLGVLLGLGYFQTREAARLLVHGEAGLLMEAVRETLRSEAPDPLELALSRHGASGLRFVGLLEADGEIHRSAGTATPGAPKVRREVRPGELQQVGEHVFRTVGGYPPRRRPRPMRDGGPEEEGRRAPVDRPRREPGPEFPRVVLEFEPVLAGRLDRTARTTGVVGLVMLGGLVGLALFSVRLRRARDELVRGLERDRHLRALGELSAVLAHEIRNPLASLKGHAQLLAEALPEGRERTKADRVVSEAIRLESLSSDLLAFARSGTCERQVLDAAALLREVAASVAETRIDVQAPSTLPWSMDARGMRQVLANILENAVHASPEGARVSALARVESGSLCFEVRDRGTGIPAGEEELIFEPFQTRKMQGTGLGLAVVRRITTLHRGTVTARNHPEGGAVFTVCIPEG